MEVVASHLHNPRRTDTPHEETLESIRRCLCIRDMRLGVNAPAAVNKAIARRFLGDGWAKGVKLAGSNLSVSFLREQVAVCVQLGNVSRTYADLLKMQTLIASGRIGLAVEVVPAIGASKQMGSNHASFERLVRDLDLFKATIVGPILVVGLENDH